MVTEKPQFTRKSALSCGCHETVIAQLLGSQHRKQGLGRAGKHLVQQG